MISPCPDIGERLLPVAHTSNPHRSTLPVPLKAHDGGYAPHLLLPHHVHSQRLLGFWNCGPRYPAAFHFDASSYPSPAVGQVARWEEICC